MIKQISGRRLTAVDSTGLARLDYSRLVPATGGQGGGLSEGRMAAQRVLAGQDLRQSFRNQGRQEDNTEREKSGGQFYSAHLLVATTVSSGGLCGPQAVRTEAAASRLTQLPPPSRVTPLDLIKDMELFAHVSGQFEGSRTGRR